MKYVIRQFKDNTVAAIAGLVIVSVSLGWLAFGFFGVHTLFTDKKVDEAAPLFDSGVLADGPEVVTDELLAVIDEAMVEDDTPLVVEAAESDPMPAAPEVLTVASGDFVGHAHPTSGQAVVLSDGSAQRFLRFENFETDNGPDLNVYLSNSSADAGNGSFDDDFIDLGDLKGNIGPQNYEIPEDVDLSIYDTVVIWCVRFGVSFGASDLT